MKISCIPANHLDLHMQIVSAGRRRFSANFQLLFRLFKGIIFLTFFTIFIVLIVVPHMNFQDVIVCILAVMPSGWGLLLVSTKTFYLYGLSTFLGALFVFLIDLLLLI